MYSLVKKANKAEALEQQRALSASATRLDDPEIRFEEKLRRKAFAHFDCQSMTANLTYARRLCNILAKRRNTTTGASAASMVTRNSDSDSEMDEGDGRSNETLQSCPYFRNELGGEEERTIALNRTTSDRPSIRLTTQSNAPLLHRPNMASGLSLLEDANERRWKLKSCPYQKLTNEKSFIIENYDIGATYYREHFYGLEHQNWFGIDDNLGPIAISIRKERLNVPSIQAADQSQQNSSHQQIKHQYRLILRTSELTVLRGSVHEDCVPSLSSSSSRHNHHSNHHAKEVLEYIANEISLSSLRLGVSNADEQLLKLDEQVLTRTYKVGVLYCKNGQQTEEEMYNNEHSSPAFDEFVSVLGEKVRLKGFEKYKAGLDTKTDTTGLHSVYTEYNNCEIHFHVSTLLPYTPNNRQQLLRKRHIGNDIVTIVFQEPDAKPFTPKTIRSHFQHVFIIVRVLPGVNGSQPTKYSVAVSRSKEVTVFGPPICEDGIYIKSKAFTEFLLSKIINAELSAHRSEKFRSMAQRTRHEYLKDLAQNYITSTTINDLSSGFSAGAKLVSSIFGSVSKKSRGKAGRDSHFIGDAAIKGAIVWEMSVEDYGQSKLVDCLVGISSDTFIIVEESTKEVIFVCPNSSILGWTSHPSFVKIFYHQGECVLLKCKDPDLDEIGEIVTRLKAVTRGCETQEIILRRNSHGHLGFHVGHEGIVTHVESYAFSWQAGLRQNFRIVEICKVAIATLDNEQIVDLLKTSIHVTVTVLPPHHDAIPRRGCNLQNCSYLTVLSNNNGNGVYENVGSMDSRNGSRSRTPNAYVRVPSEEQNNRSLNMVAISNSSIYSNRNPLSPSSSFSSNSLPFNSQAPQKNTMFSRVPSAKLPRKHDIIPKNFGNLVSSKSELSLAHKIRSWTNRGSSAQHGSYAPTMTNGHSEKNGAHEYSSGFSDRITPTESRSSSRSHLSNTVCKVHPSANGHVNESKSLPVSPEEVNSRSMVGITNSSIYSNRSPSTPSGSLSCNSSPYNSLAPQRNGIVGRNPSTKLPREHGMIHLSQKQFGHLANGVGRSSSELSLNCKTLYASTNSLSREFPMPIPLTNYPYSRSQSHHFVKLNENTSLSTFNEFGRQPIPNGQPTSGNTKSTSSGYHSDSNSSNKYPVPNNGVRPLPHMGLSSIHRNNGHDYRQSNENLVTLSVNQTIAKDREQREPENETNYPIKSSKVYQNPHNSRQGVNNNNNIKRIKNSSNKSSASSCSGSSSSTLQENLLKLINPENYLSDTITDCEPNSSSGETEFTQYSTPYSSLERSDKMPSTNNDVILTVAQPAHVITSEPSSPSDFETTRGRSRDQESTATQSLSPCSSEASKSMSSSFEPSSLPLICDNEVDIDWPSLVNTATKAMQLTQQAEKAQKQKQNLTSSQLEESLAWLKDFGSALPGNPPPLPSESVKELENTVKKLQIDLVKEQCEKTTLEKQVQNLREENQRLHEESQTAAAQLKKFSEWFFQNINAK